METRYVRPAQPLLDHLVTTALAGVGVRAAPAEWVETGSSSVVALAGPVAVRVSRAPSVTAELLRTQGLVDALPPLPFAVPASLGEPVREHGLVAVPTRRLTGAPHPAGTGNPEQLRDLLTAVHGVPLDDVREHLAPPRAFCGGLQWERVLRDRVVPALPPDVRDEARRRIDALADLPATAVVLNHGDLAGSNMLWEDGHVTGVLDWDLASAEDPAEDVASLLSWHGWHLLGRVTDPQTAARAGVFRRSFPLQLVAFHLLHDRAGEEVRRVVQRMSEKLRA